MILGQRAIMVSACLALGYAASAFGSHRSEAASPTVRAAAAGNAVAYAAASKGVQRRATA
jgi:hypothetical protein